MRIRSTPVLTLVFALLVAACGEDAPAETSSRPADADEASESETPGSTEPDDVAAERDDRRSPSTTERPDDPRRTTSRRPECEDGPGKTVTMLDPVVIPAVEVDEQVIEEVEIDGTVIPEQVIPAIRIPEQVVDAGCIIEYDAPTGCLGAVEITGVTIPAVEVPGAEISDVRVGGRTIEGTSVEARRVEGRSVEGRRVEQRCQREEGQEGQLVPGVFRPHVFRPHAFRPHLFRRALFRGRTCVSAGECLPAINVPAVNVSPVNVSPVNVPPATLPSYFVEGTDAEVIEDEGMTAIVAPADVLFDFDVSDLRGDAIPTLQAIAAEIAEVAGSDAAITVEGHTDSIGSHDYNQALSEARAESVATWLSGPGGIDRSRITTVGYAATQPVAPNTTESGADDPAGRALNRRVVIAVSTR